MPCKVLAGSGEVGTNTVGRQHRHLGDRALHVVRQCIDAIAMKQVRGDRLLAAIAAG